VVRQPSIQLLAEPSSNRVTEEADLPLVDDAIGNEVSRGKPKQILSGQPSHLQVVRHGGTELDHPVIEERDANLERACHGRAIEVVQHVINEAKLLVEVERRREWVDVWAKESRDDVGSVCP